MQSKQFLIFSETGYIDYMRFLTALTIGILSFAVIVLLVDLIFEKTYQFPKRIDYGVTFSQTYASYLKLDWQKTYIQILDDLLVRNLRLLSYWNILQPQSEKYDFADLDFMLSEAEKRRARVILVLGARQPRWPECHIPDWAKNLSLRDRQAKTLEFIGRVVERYKNQTTILAWQVENEPLFSVFGEGCDPPDKDFLKSEVELVRKLNSKPIIVTDSGELGFWITSMKLSDIFGTTLYRSVYDKTFGYIMYPYPPFLYNLKSTIVRSLFAKNNQKTIISELQAEPWSSKNELKNMPLQQQVSLFPIDEFKKYISYAKQTGFDTVYLWGVEWWFWMEKQGHPQYLEYAKMFFK